MKLFFKIVYAKWCDLKIWVHVNFLYQYKSNYKRIKSILPANLKILEGVIIGKNVTILSYLKELGRQVYIGGNTYIGLCTKIGSFTSISFDVKIGLRNHPLDFLSTSPVFYGEERGWVMNNNFVAEHDTFVEIGSDVLISSNVVIIQGVKIGHGAVIAAGAVVTKNVEPYSVVGGVPAKLIRYRFDEVLRKRLLDSNWWEYSDNILKDYIHLVDKPDEFLDNLEGRKLK